ncbi:hypothetical protein LSH36_157g04044, partial [Paralvinella palmiformis]
YRSQYLGSYTSRIVLAESDIAEITGNEVFDPETDQSPADFLPQPGPRSSGPSDGCDQPTVDNVLLKFYPRMILAQFEPPVAAEDRVYITSEDAAYVNFKDYGLTIQKSVRPKNGQTLYLSGTCVGLFENYNNMTLGSLVYTVKVDDSWDLHQRFKTKHISIDQVTGLETTRRIPSRTFLMTDSGEPGVRDYWGQYFRIEPSTGMLCQLQMVQRLLRNAITGRDVFFNFTFTIRAYQTDNPQKYDTSMLFVEIADDNEFAPAFERKLYRAVLSEYPTIPDGVRVLTVKAVDKDFYDERPYATDEDIRENARVEYRIERIRRVGGSASYTLMTDLGRFSVDPETCMISLSGSLRDLRRKREYPVFKLDISATDQALRHTARLYIQTRDVFLAVKNGSRNISNLSTSSFTFLTLALISPAYLIKNRSGMATVFITISPANDHPPTFTPSTGLSSRTSQYTDGRYHVTEDAPIGTLVANTRVSINVFSLCK